MTLLEHRLATLEQAFQSMETISVDMEKNGTRMLGNQENDLNLRGRRWWLRIWIRMRVVALTPIARTALLTH